MQKEIKYTGFSETPSDYECPDGDLATVVGMVPEDEAMKPIQQPQLQFKLPSIVSGETWSVVFIHKNTGFTHYIVCWERTVEINSQSVNRKYYYWIGNFTPGETPTFNANNLIVFLDDKEVYELNALGNTLMILTKDGVEYFLWKGSNNKYLELGSQLPETLLSFGLQGELVEKNNDLGKIYLVTDGYRSHWHWDDNWDSYISTDNIEIDEMTNVVMSRVNKFIKEEGVDKNKFMFPFLVRYAYRLYDGTLVMHSSPVLMITDSGAWTPKCDITKRNQYVGWNEDKYLDLAFKIRSLVFDLDYKAVIPSNLDNWKDIVKSVDIFVSAPIYTYDQSESGKVKGYHNSLTDILDDGSTITDLSGYSISKISNVSGISPDVYSKKPTNSYVPPIEITGIYNVSEGDYLEHQCNNAFTLPYFARDIVTKNIKDTKTFYLIKSIPIRQLQTVRTKIELESGCLSVLVNKEVMTDEMVATNNFIAKTSFAYNQRINFANMSYNLRYPAPAKVCSSYTDNNTVQYDIYVYIDAGDREVIIKAMDTLNVLEDCDPFAQSNPFNPFAYFYYPHPDASKVVVKKHGSPDVIYEFQLARHDFLNGAVFFDGWFPTVTVNTEFPTPSTDRTIALPNKLYTSEVGNPFVFTSRGIQTVGVGTILGVRPIVKAMSLAQYGQHDLYVFSSDGVWSLEVDSEGYMQHPHLATPDIVLGNGDSISQIDGGVLFATDRGIMLISGSDSVCISDMLNSTSPFIPIGTTAAQDLLPGLRNVVDADMIAQMQTDTFRNFITDCRMTYDYPHQRIMVYSPTHDYAYVYSLKSKQWGMMPSKIQSTPLNYPAALAMVVGSDSRNWLVDYSKDDIVQGVIQVESGLIITRPLKLDYPDVLKTVDTIIQRGKFQKGHAKSILYGSRDLLNWQLVWSSVDHYLRGFSGTPYKYFRLALICDLAEGEDLMGCTVQFTPRLTDQLR